MLILTPLNVSMIFHDVLCQHLSSKTLLFGLSLIDYFITCIHEGRRRSLIGAHLCPKDTQKLKQQFSSECFVTQAR